MNSNKTKGFTLVEAVVVAVLMAILAAIAIPIYNGFVADARLDTVSNLSQTAAAAANIYWRKTGSSPASFSPNTQPLFLSYNATKYTIALNGTDSIRVTAAGVTPTISKSSYFK